jgi:hypothetical protein
MLTPLLNRLMYTFPSLGATTQNNRIVIYEERQSALGKIKNALAKIKYALKK